MCKCFGVLPFIFRLHFLSNFGFSINLLNLDTISPIIKTSMIRYEKTHYRIVGSFLRLRWILSLNCSDHYCIDDIFYGTSATEIIYGFIRRRDTDTMIHIDDRLQEFFIKRLFRHWDSRIALTKNELEKKLFAVQIDGPTPQFTPEDGDAPFSDGFRRYLHT